MEEELVLDEAARLFALSRQGGSRSCRLYRRFAIYLCRVALELRANRQFPETAGKKARRRRRGKGAGGA
jgi:hypothetical protein